MVSINYFGVIFVIFISTIHNGESLRCWSCSSDLDITCMDHFNTTKLMQFNSAYHNTYPQSSFQTSNNVMPRLMDCNAPVAQLYGQRPMCVKKVVTEPSGRQRVNRDCKIVSNQQATGRCPTEAIGRGFTVDFCEYCDYDGCNSATSLHLNLLLTILPCIISFIVFYK